MGLDILLGVGIVLLVAAGASLRVVKQFERGLIFRFGRVLDHQRGPGLTMLIPVADRLRKVSLQVVTLSVPAQEGITRDNVTVRVDAVLYFRVVDPLRAIVNVEDYPYAVLQVAQTSLRSVIGKSDLDDLLTNRERLNEGLELMIDSPAVEWGIHIDRVEIKDVALPDTMKRSMSRQAEAERERRARVISADGELQASDKLAQAAQRMADTPGALQLRLLETIVEVAAEKTSTLVLPFPVELLRFLERNTTNEDADRHPDSALTGPDDQPAVTPADRPAVISPNRPAVASPDRPTVVPADRPELGSADRLEVADGNRVADADPAAITDANRAAITEAVGQGVSSDSAEAQLARAAELALELFRTIGTPSKERAASPASERTESQ